MMAARVTLDDLDHDAQRGAVQTFVWTSPGKTGKEGLTSAAVHAAAHPKGLGEIQHMNMCIWDSLIYMTHGSL